MLNLTVTAKNQSTTTVTLTGQLNDDSAPQLDKKVKQLLAEGNKVLVLDMAGLEFITSVGIGTIVKIKTSLVKCGGDLATINMPAHIKKVFDIVRLLPSMNVFADTAELDNYLIKIQKRMAEES
jgi:anti-anti-sigma factor